MGKYWDKNVSENTENHVVVLGYGRFGQSIVES